MVVDVVGTLETKVADIKKQLEDAKKRMKVSQKAEPEKVPQLENEIAELRKQLDASKTQLKDAQALEKQIKSMEAKLKSKIVKTRIAALEHLKHCDPDERAPHMRTASGLLRDADKEVRKAAVGLIDHILHTVERAARAPHVVAVAELLRDKDKEVRAAAVGVMRLCSTIEREPHMADIGALLQDKISMVREAALLTIAECR